MMKSYTTRIVGNIIIKDGIEAIYLIFLVAEISPVHMELKSIMV